MYELPESDWGWGRALLWEEKQSNNVCTHHNPTLISVCDIPNMGNINWTAVFLPSYLHHYTMCHLVESEDVNCIFLSHAYLSLRYLILSPHMAMLVDSFCFRVLIWYCQLVQYMRERCISGVDWIAYPCKFLLISSVPECNSQLTHSRSFSLGQKKDVLGWEPQGDREAVYHSLAIFVQKKIIDLKVLLTPISRRGRIWSCQGWGMIQILGSLLS